MINCPFCGRGFFPNLDDSMQECPSCAETFSFGYGEDDYFNDDY